ncbi:alpha/beta hydrolase, partial [Arachidicoccus sp.]|uniref:alpha/beta hydrolase n=1 Tax=Arachidicoccus sp. TaxID=1872624 RepID=UPI003D2347FD
MEQGEIVPLTDLQKAARYVSGHSKEYGINIFKVGVLGFSAGGHLVAMAETHFSKTVLKDPKQFSLRPSFVIAAYQVVSFADSLTHSQSRNNLIG